MTASRARLRADRHRNSALAVIGVRLAAKVAESTLPEMCQVALRRVRRFESCWGRKIEHES